MPSGTTGPPSLNENTFFPAGTIFASLSFTVKELQVRIGACCTQSIFVSLSFRKAKGSIIVSMLIEFEMFVFPGFSMFGTLEE